MKEYIKMGFGFTLGVVLSMSAIKAINKWAGSDKNEEKSKPEETVTEEMA